MAAETEYRHRILIADSDRDLCRQLADMLAELGYETVGCSSERATLEAMRRESFSLAFVNVRMPGTGRFELARRLRQEYPETALICIAGSSPSRESEEIFRLRAIDCLSKPFAPQDVATAMARFEEREALRDEARKARRRYTRLVDDIPLIIFSMRQGFRIDAINQAVAGTLDYTPEEVLGDADWLADRIHPDDWERLKAILGHALENGLPFSAHCRLIHKNGRTVHCIMKSIPEEDRNLAEDPRIEGVIIDITDRVLLERTLVQDEKLKTLGAISAELAHEIRNPLVCIGGFAHRLQRQAPDMAEPGIILREASRLENFLGRIKDYMRPLRITRRRCEVNSLLAECINLAYPEMAGKNIWCEFTLARPLSPVYADPDILGQVFYHIIQHGLDLSRNNRAVSLRTRENGECVDISFELDVRPEVRIDPDRIFLPFDMGGPGMGLSLSHRLIKKMGGLLAYSRTNGTAVFTATLPKDTSAEGLLEEFDGRPLLSPSGEARMARDESFERQLAREWERARKKVSPLSILLIDVDHFEPFISKVGTTQAGVVLDSISQTLSATLNRPGDFYESCGSQLFSAVLPDTNEMGALLAAESIRNAVSTLNIPHPDPSAGDRLTVSIGVASTFPSGQGCPDDIISQAAQALFTAKQTGRNRTHAQGLKPLPAQEIPAP